MDATSGDMWDGYVAGGLPYTADDPRRPLNVAALATLRLPAVLQSRWPLLYLHTRLMATMAIRSSRAMHLVLTRRVLTRLHEPAGIRESNEKHIRVASRTTLERVQQRPPGPSLCRWGGYWVEVPRTRTVVETYTATVYALQPEEIQNHFTGKGQASRMKMSGRHVAAGTGCTVRCCMARHPYGTARSKPGRLASQKLRQRFSQTGYC